MPGWEHLGREAADAQASTAIDVDAFETPEELESSLGELVCMRPLCLECLRQR